jgi:diacylglycerol kinase family enzyme
MRGEGSTAEADEAPGRAQHAGEKATLFHHPGAGKGEWSADRIMKALRKVGFEPVLSERAKDDWEAAMAATEGLAIVAGGDGTVAKVAALVAERDIPVAILPTGSGNNIARSLGVLASVEEIVPRLRTARSGPLRLCKAKGAWGERLVVEGVGLGALAHSVRELQEEKLDGEEKLVRGRDSLVSAIEAQEPLDVRLNVDGKVIDGAFLLLEVLNLPMIGPNIRLVSDTALKGENLSVALLPEEDRGAMVEWLVAGGSGVAPLRHIQGRRVTFEGGAQPLRLEDKTSDWDGSGVEIEAEPHRVRVLRPGDDR